jgi:hypothetical protein
MTEARTTIAETLLLLDSLSSQLPVSMRPRVLGMVETLAEMSEELNEGEKPMVRWERSERLKNDSRSLVEVITGRLVYEDDERVVIRTADGMNHDRRRALGTMREAA